ncbi:hypothetical protein MCAG_03852 [Micromonospora sp. ATCC 39149]|uniref:hypothetical protein n=1 Tax=Micromonospora sp. (strain ATCC 39149 / NRRL 15099 / SCC 1413) TaxID=219305 RepID=UPI0001A5058D|nr:hypothetical protein [Micromonospora sp. ATCC 39149]EEP73525.1 hypothetical protein MCAG_03852 [Micromonospora sp. ATCC 39149]
MTRSEMALLLGLMAGRDARKVDQTMVEAWFEDAGDLDLTDARAAVTAWYRQTRERMMPADLRAGVRVVREDRKRREQPHEIRAIAGRYDTDVTRDLRIERGVAQCRAVLAPVIARLEAARDGSQPEASESDEIRRRALEVARAQKRGQRS